MLIPALDYDLVEVGLFLTWSILPSGWTCVLTCAVCPRVSPAEALRKVYVNVLNNIALSPDVSAIVLFKNQWFPKVF